MPRATHLIRGKMHNDRGHGERRFTKSRGRVAMLIGIMLGSSIELSPAADVFYITNTEFAGKEITLLSSQIASAKTNATTDYLELIRLYEDCTRAQKEKALVQQTNFSPFLVFQDSLSSAGSLFQSNNLPKTGAFFWRVQADTDRVTDIVKVAFRRPRPIPEIASFYGERQTNGFPSGHAVRGVVFSLIVAEMFPEDSEAITTQGAEVGWSRARILMHYPTDIRAGFELGTNIFNELNRNPRFAKDLAESKKEVDALLAGLKNAINLHENLSKKQKGHGN
jgi:hypothetical protein